MNPILFRYGAVAIHYSHIIYFIAFLLSYNLTFYKAKKIGIIQADWDLGINAYVIGGILGARIGYIVTHVSYFMDRWREAFTLWHGAFTLWGSILGFILTAMLCAYCRKKPEIWSKGLDILAVAYPVFLSISQLALWTEGEGWGKIGYGFGAMWQGGLSRYPLWGGYLFAYLLVAGLIFNRKSRWSGENFLLMSAGLALINLLFTPWIPFLENLDQTIHIFWVLSFLVAAFLIILWKRYKQRV